MLEWKWQLVLVFYSVLCFSVMTERSAYRDHHDKSDQKVRLLLPLRTMIQNLST